MLFRSVSDPQSKSAESTSNGELDGRRSSAFSSLSGAEDVATGEELVVRLQAAIEPEPLQLLEQLSRDEHGPCAFTGTFDPLLLPSLYSYRTTGKHPNNRFSRKCSEARSRTTACKKTLSLS